MTHEERALLGAVISKNNAIGIALEHVQPDDFSTPEGRAIYQTVVNLSRDTKLVDPILIGNALDDSILVNVGGRAFLHTLVDTCPFPTNVTGYAKAVREAAIDRQARSTFAKVQGYGSEYLASLQDALFSIERKEQIGNDVRSAAVDMIRTAGKAKPALRYPWERIQAATRGLRNGWLCVLAGETGHGKSAAGIMIAVDAINDKKRVVYNSLEMADRDVTARIAMRYGLNSERYWRDQMTPEDGRVLQRIADDPKWVNLRVEAAHNIGQLAPLCRRWDADLLVIDHLQLLAGERYEDISKATRQLKLLAGSLDIPVLLLSQLSRGEPGVDNTPPKLKRLRGSGTIEQDADTVVFVWRKRDENEQLTNESIISVAKSRYGHTCSLRAHFDGDRQEFRVITGGQ